MGNNNYFGISRNQQLTAAQNQTGQANSLAAQSGLSAQGGLQNVNLHNHTAGQMQSAQNQQHQQQQYSASYQSGLVSWLPEATPEQVAAQKKTIALKFLSYPPEVREAYILHMKVLALKETLEQNGDPNFFGIQKVGYAPYTTMIKLHELEELHASEELEKIMLTEQETQENSDRIEMEETLTNKEGNK